MNADGGIEPNISREKIVGENISSKFPSLWTSFPLLRKPVPNGVSFGELRIHVAIELSLLFGKIFLWGIRKLLLFLTY